jgi:cation diffusion facilitator family transporter
VESDLEIGELSFILPTETSVIWKRFYTMEFKTADKGAEGQQISRAKARATVVSLVFNLVATSVKFIAAAITGSVSLFSEAVHSATDLVSSCIAFVSVRVSAVPPDEEHPFGHGKVESLTGFGESIMVAVVVIFIVVEAAQRLRSKHTLSQNTLVIGLVLMAVVALGSFAVSLYIGRTANQTESTALKVNAQHFRIDFITSLGVFAGLSITKMTGWTQADPIIAILLAVWMTYGAYGLAAKAFQELIDVRLTEDEIAKIRKIIESYPLVVSYHRLRTRRSGSVRYIDFHIVVPREWDLVQAHGLADKLEKEIRQDLAPAEVVIHVDPFDPARAKSA